jgi:LuxR family maltose regulon positive regulatory protein
MDDQLLIIDTRIPPCLHGLVARPRLVEDIEHALGEARVVLLSAPAGYGKTALLTEWAHATERSVAWLTVEAEQNDPERLVRYLAAAWSVVDPLLLDSPVGLLLETYEADVDLVVRAMANHALLSGISPVFVLDDLHLIQNPAAAGVLIFLIDHLPADARFVAACRNDISLPRSRLRVRHRMKEIGPDQLAFRLEETARLFEQAQLPALSEHDIALVQERCEGWVAGLQLVARSNAARGSDLEGVLGSQGAIAHYLIEEVTTALDEETRRFLLQVSVLDQLCPALCDAVTAAGTSQSMLAALERANFFLQPMDAERNWYRLHPLLVETLRRQLRASMAQSEPVLHMRAARWFLEQQMIDEAFRHAVAGGDRELAAQIAESYVVTKLESGEYRMIQEWLVLVPAAWYAACPELNILPMAFSIFSGDVDGGLRIIDELDARLVAAAGRAAERLRAKLAVVRCAIACFMDEVPKAEAYAATALRDLDAGDVTFRANTHHALADTYRRHGRWSEAESHYLQVLDFVTDPAMSQRSAHVYGALADLELRQGHLRAAASYWQKDIETIRDQENWGKLPAPIIGWAFIRYGELLYEWNRLDEARNELERGLERAELGGDTRAMIAGYLLASRLRMATADLDGAADYLDQAAALVERARYPEWLSRVDRNQALLLARRDDAARALDWCRQIEFGNTLQTRPDNQEAFLALAQLLIQFGGEAERQRARAVLADQLMLAEVEGRRGLQVEALALAAIERLTAGDQRDALIALDQALGLAEPERPIRLLIDLGTPLQRLLQLAGQRGALSEYGSLLLAASGQASPPGDRMVEPLSERELEILRLVAAGLTNREVGDRLYISDETVKKHLANIYGKLQVHRRIEAAVRARELGLLR